MKTFEVLDISGDAGIKAYGETLADAFTHAAMGMYSLITDPEGIQEKRELAIKLTSHSLEGLLVSWLNELIFHVDTYGFIGKTIRIDTLDATALTAQIAGEEFDPGRHERRLLIKAATYHQLSIVHKDREWVLQVIFDI